MAHCIEGIHDGFDQLIDVVWRLLVLKQLDRSKESETEFFFYLSLISLFEHKLDNNFVTEGVFLNTSFSDFITMAWDSCAHENSSIVDEGTLVKTSPL
jgi:hypothetical protein